MMIVAAAVLFYPDTAYAQDNRSKTPAYLTIGGFIDGQYTLDADQNTFFVRRARLSISGDVTEHLEYKLQTEMAGGVRMIDAFVKCKFCNWLNLELGQFKTPFTLESQYILLNKEGIDYAQAINRLSGYNDPLPGNRTNGRDIGVMVYGGLMKLDGGYSLLNYNVGVFNGSGINRKDDNLTKDIIARLDVHPFLKDLVLSASLIRGTYADAGNPDAANNRYSFGGEYKSDALTIRSEYVRADIETGGEPLTTDGYYLVAGWWLPLESSFRLRPVLRYDRLNSAGTSSVLYMAGLDCWPLSHLRLQAGYTICTEIPSATPHHLIQAMASVKF